MPTYRSITISITSQFDIRQLPEYAPPTSTNDPFSTLPPLLDPDLSLVTVFIPTYPSSQFWLRYSIAPPYPPKAIYYFKLFLNGRCVVSWGCGEDDGYRGKTVFGLYDSGGSWDGESTTERRMLCFSGSENPGDVMEIKVYRAKGRQRVTPELQDYKDVMPIMEDQLVALRVASPDPSTQSSPQIHPTKPASRKSSNLTTCSSQSNSSSSSSSTNTHEETLLVTANAATLSPPSHATFRPRLLRSISVQENSPQISTKPIKHAAKRQSVHQAVTAPSLISLAPPHEGKVTQARFASLVRRGTRTPSPQKQSIRERVPTPSPTRDPSKRNLGLLPPPPTPNFTVGSSQNVRPRARRSGSMGLLMNAVSSAVNRKARAASEETGEGSPKGKTLVLQAMQSESEHDMSTAEAENKDNSSTTETNDRNVEEPSAALGEMDSEKGNQIVDKDKASVETLTISTQRSKSESESDTSSKRAAKERKGFLKFNLLCKKVEVERSASSTPDTEHDNQGNSDTSSKKWRSWGRKGLPQDAREQQAKALLDTM